jgi:hypothetical protein
MKQCVAGAYVEKSVLFWPDLIVESTALELGRSVISKQNLLNKDDKLALEDEL